MTVWVAQPPEKWYRTVESILVRFSPDPGCYSPKVQTVLSGWGRYRGSVGGGRLGAC